MLVGVLTVLMIEPKFGLETSPTGWSKPDFCDQKNLHHIEPKDSRMSRGGGEIRCWG